MAVTAITKKQIRDDLILRFTQGKPSSDFEVPNSQIDRWIDISRDRFLADLLFKTGKYDGFYIDPTYVTIEKGLALTVVASTDEVLPLLLLAISYVTTIVGDIV